MTGELRELLARPKCRPVPAGRPLSRRPLRPLLHPAFPAEVRALLLLEPAHEDYNAYMPQELVEQWQAWDPGQALPEELPDELIAFYRGPVRPGDGGLARGDPGTPHRAPR